MVSSNFTPNIWGTSELVSYNICHLPWPGHMYNTLCITQIACGTHHTQRKTHQPPFCPPMGMSLTTGSLLPRAYILLSWHLVKISIQESVHIFKAHWASISHLLTTLHPLSLSKAFPSSLLLHQSVSSHCSARCIWRRLASAHNIHNCVLFVSSINSEFIIRSQLMPLVVVDEGWLVGFSFIKMY